MASENKCLLYYLFLMCVPFRAMYFEGTDGIILEMRQRDAQRRTYYPKRCRRHSPRGRRSRMGNFRKENDFSRGQGRKVKNQGHWV